MTEERKQEIVSNLQEIFAKLDEDASMFDLISEYNKNHNNIELIGGKFARENGLDLPS